MTSDNNFNHFLADVLDEIALEGLEGITLQALWIRLKNRSSGFCYDVDTNEGRLQVWSLLIQRDSCNDSWQFFLLPEARKNFVYYNRFDHIDSEFGIYSESPDDVPDDIYGWNPVVFKQSRIPDKDHKLRGNCSTLKTRQEITKSIFDCQPTLQKVEKEYGNRLVIVASQEERNKCLGLEDDSILKEGRHRCYAFLEAVGRMRHLGLLTFGKESLKDISPKTSFYLRKKLIEKGLVRTTQFYVMRTVSKSMSKGKIVFLKRFYQKRFTPLQLGALRLSSYLSQQKNTESDWSIMRQNVDASKRLLTNVLAQHSDNFEVFMREYHADEGTVKKKFIRLLKPVEYNEDEEDDQEADDDVSENNTSTSTANLNKLTWKPTRILADRTLLSQVLTLIETCPSENGMSTREICETLSITENDAEKLINLLIRNKCCKVMKVTHGRTKLNRFVANTKNFDDITKIHGLSFDAKNDTIVTLERANYMLDILNKADKGVVVGLHHFTQEIREKEKNLKETIDTKTVARILIRLRDEGKLAIHKFSRTANTRNYEVMVVTKPNVTSKDPTVTEQINQWVFKSNIPRKRDTGNINRRKALEETDLCLFDTDATDVNFLYQPSAAKKYGVLPKMRKIFAVYRFLLQQYNFKKFEKEVYTDWRKVIKPIIFGQGKTFTLGELIPRMPIFMFCQIVSLPYHIPQLLEILEDEEERLKPVGSLPPDIMKGLFYRRKFFFTFCEVLSYLTDMGLVEVDIKEFAPRDGARIRVKNSFKFTFQETEDDENRTLKTYKLQTIEDVDELEEDLFRHACNDCHGCSIPETLFIHVNKNWTLGYRGPKEKMPEDDPNAMMLEHNRLQTKQTASGRKTLLVGSIGSPTKSKYKSAPKTPTVIEGAPFTDSAFTPRKNRSPGKSVARKRKRNQTKSPTRVTEVVTEDTTDSRGRKRSKRSEKYDEKDKVARSLVTGMRSVWSQPEDHFLLLCRVSSLLLDSSCNSHLCVSSRVVRDEIHKWLPISRDKTSQAVQRRILYLLKNQHTNQSVNDWVSDLRQDDAFLYISKPSLPKSPEYQDAWKEEYLMVLDKVLYKFMSPEQELESGMSSSCIELPEDVDLSQYSLVESVNVMDAHTSRRLFSDPKNIVDIHVSVVNNVLIASLLTKLRDNDEKFREVFSYALFRIYQKYPDSLIRSVVASLKKANVIASIKKDKGHIPLKHHGITPYKISAHYKFLLQTKLSIDSLLPVLNSLQDYKLGDYNLRTTAALATSLVTSSRDTFSVDIPDDFVTIDEDSPFLKPSPGAIKKPLKIDRKAHSRTVLFAVREQLSQKTQRDFTTKVQDFLVLNQSNVQVHAKQMFEPDNKFQHHLEKLISNNVSAPATKTTGRQVDKKLIEFIASKKELGADISELQLFSGSSSVENKLTILMDKKILHRVGVSNFRYVHRDFITPWVVHSVASSKTATESADDSTSTKKHQGESKIEFVAKVWRTPTGEADLKTLFTLMEAMIGFLMSHPGQKMDAILKHYHICAPATQLIEVMELLETAGCLSIIKIPKKKKMSLFSRPTEDAANGLQTFYEASPSALLVLSHIRQQMGV